MLCGKIEDSFATVFRQVVLTRFELDLHRARAEQGELSGEAIGELWLAANRKMFGDVVEMTDGYGCWWSYIGHFIRSPFYCYAYAFGELLVLALIRSTGRTARRSCRVTSNCWRPAAAMPLTCCSGSWGWT